MWEELGDLAAPFFQSPWGDATLWFGGVWAVVLFIRKVSKDADEELDKDARTTLVTTLTGLRSQKVAWIPDFTLVFDRFFGEKHFRWRCIYRSVLISAFCFMLLMVVAGTELLDVGMAVNLFFFFLVGLWLNAFIDYWSLLETRVLLSTRLPIFLKIALDVVLTTLLTWLWVALMFMFIGAEDSFVESLEGIGREFIEGGPDAVLWRVILATSFTTSIWLWLHGLSQFAIRGFSSIAFVMNKLNVKEKPLRAIGTTINIFVLLIGAVLFPVYLVAR